MLRLWSVGALLALCVLQVGCGCCGQRFGCIGCGEKYWGAYVNDPPRCEPCDCLGNWIGRGCGSNCGCGEAACGEAACGEASCGEPSCGVDSCCSSCDSGCGSQYPWMRSLKRRASFWQMLSACNKSKDSNCCGNGCGMSCGEPTCSEPACGEPTCGEPGCGCTSGGAPIMHEHSIPAPSAPAAPMPPATPGPQTSQRRPTPVHPASRSTTIDYRMKTASTCNCGKQH